MTTEVPVRRESEECGDEGETMAGSEKCAFTNRLSPWGIRSSVLPGHYRLCNQFPGYIYSVTHPLLIAVCSWIHLPALWSVPSVVRHALWPEKDLGVVRVLEYAITYARNVYAIIPAMHLLPASKMTPCYCPSYGYSYLWVNPSLSVD